MAMWVNTYLLPGTPDPTKDLEERVRKLAASTNVRVHEHSYNVECWAWKLQRGQRGRIFSTEDKHHYIVRKGQAS